MLPHPVEDPTRFDCTECGWTFYIQHPLTPEMGFQEQQALAKRWYEKHNCLQFAARIPDSEVAFQQDAG
jgi:hypothetical protein